MRCYSYTPTVSPKQARQNLAEKQARQQEKEKYLEELDSYLEGVRKNARLIMHLESL